ncbi:hypothetical protein [Mangrovihabitans endophyticus]|uniref:Ricin-type beta-trefoil lectin domain-like n=1 Tax=Mangrovihabitans endophyticus TaxID=1751298 RepID=A0A8J3FN24_9ACTN|nr:hypothetical protein [Mangrovihabitans endophyticus]GGK80684.1 hypothetical protein GCM10012284_13280 [Mangrovihabitans endophyticus]
MRYVRLTALALLAAGLVLSQQACDTADEPSAGASGPPSSAPATSASPSSASSPSPSASPSAGGSDEDDILGGDRKVTIVPVQSQESVLAVNDDGRLNPTDGPSDSTLFVLEPAGDKYMIETYAAGDDSRTRCMGVHKNGSAPLTVEAAPCDRGRDGQLFSIVEREEDTDAGDPTYAIFNQGAFLQIVPGRGLIAEELGDSRLRTTYTFADNGPASD